MVVDDIIFHPEVGYLPFRPDAASCPSAGVPSVAVMQNVIDNYIARRHGIGRRELVFEGRSAVNGDRIVIKVLDFEAIDGDVASALNQDNIHPGVAAARAAVEDGGVHSVGRVVPPRLAVVGTSERQQSRPWIHAGTQIGCFHGARRPHQISRFFERLNRRAQRTRVVVIPIGSNVDPDRSSRTTPSGPRSQSTATRDAHGQDDREQ